jgi:hypothetical protein
LNKTMSTASGNGVGSKAADGERSSLQTANNGGPTDSSNYISQTPTGQ